MKRDYTLRNMNMWFIACDSRLGSVRPNYTYAISGLHFDAQKLEGTEPKNTGRLRLPDL